MKMCTCDNITLKLYEDCNALSHLEIIQIENNKGNDDYSFLQIILFIFSENTLFIQIESKNDFHREINDIRIAIGKMRNDALDYIVIYFECEDRYEIILSKLDNGEYMMESNDRYLDDKIMVANLDNLDILFQVLEHYLSSHITNYK